MNYCTRCIMPDSKPDLWFDENGVCSACLNYEKRVDIDWKKREVELVEIIDKNRGAYDCIIPVSGGKDSTYQAIKIKELGFNPLLVTATTCDLSSTGERNIRNLQNMGFDHTAFTPNRRVRKILNRAGLGIVGDISYPEHVSIFTIPVRASIAYATPLIIWGENSQNEYGGPAADADSPILNRRWLEEFGGLNGLRVADLIGYEGITERDLIPYIYPTDDELTRVGVTGLFLGHYVPWDGRTNADIAIEHGFEVYGDMVEGSCVNYENLDNYQTGIHDWFKFLKFGFGRATDLLCMAIRRGRISREYAIEVARERDGAFPESYLGKSLDDILRDIDMTRDDFIKIAHKFRNKRLVDENFRLCSPVV